MRIYKLASIAVLLLTIVGCNKHHNVAPFGWEPISPEVDSLMVKLEYCWLDFADDSEIDSLLQRLDNIAAANPGDTQIALRSLYWRGRMAWHQGDIETGDTLFAKAYALNDSASHPYLTNRLNWTLEPNLLPYDIDVYDYLKQQAEFFEQAGDLMLASSRWMDLAMMLNDLGQYNRATEFLDRSDSLCHLGGFTHMILGNRLNRANILSEAGHNRQAADIYHQLLADSIFCQDVDAVNIVYNNLFIRCNDTAALFLGLQQASEFPHMAEHQAYFEAAASGVMLARNDVDSALVYAEKAMAGFPLISSLSQRIDVLAWTSEAYRRAGNQSMASQLLNQRLEDTELMIRDTRRDEIFNHDFNEKLSLMELSRERRSFQSRVMAIAVTSASVLILLALAFVYYRRNHRHRVQHIEQQLNLEKSQRRVLAMKLALDQKDTLIANIENNLTDVDASTRSKIASAIRTHDTAASTESETFERTFSELHPDFTRRLREQWPALTETDIRMLSLIALGLSNRQIADTLAIRPESVKQARWRLRNKMQLTPDTTLESLLSSLL